MTRVPLLEVAPLAVDRIQPFEGNRPYMATGGLDDEAHIRSTPITYAERPSRADLAIRPGDVCFARMVGTQKILEFAEEHRNLILSTGFAVLRPIENKLHPAYLRHWLSSVEFQSLKDKLCTGATQRAITNENISSLRIPMPPSIGDQIRIADILDKASTLRSNRCFALAKLDELNRSIFLDMFGDPIANPRGWPCETLETFFHFTTGKLDSNAAVASGRYPFFTCAREESRIDTFAFDCEALLLAGNNATADYSVKHYKGKFNAYQRTYVITHRDVRNSYEYSRYVLEHRLGELKRLSKGTGTKYLTLELLNRIQIPVPPHDMQREFAGRVSALENLKSTCGRALADLNVLCSVLQHRAFQEGL